MCGGKGKHQLKYTAKQHNQQIKELSSVRLFTALAAFISDKSIMRTTVLIDEALIAY